jgi:hypothetical protein
MKGLSRLLHYLVEKEKLGVARIYKCETKIIAVPEAMSIQQQQEYLDELWPTVFAAGAVARLWLGARPWSELKKSKVEEVRYGLSTDYRTFYSPRDGKTGWRPVEVPPIARLLFEQLDKEGRLSRERTPEGFHIIYVGAANNWTYHYAKLGYMATTGIVRQSQLDRGMTREEIMDLFRARCPIKHKAFTTDFPRHTNISAYLHVSNGQTDACATYHGNSRKIIDKHYRSLMSKAMAFLHFRLFPSIVAHLFKRDEIALPSFCTVTMDELEKAEYNKLVASLPKLDTEKEQAEFIKRLESEKEADYKARGEKIKAAFVARKNAQSAQLRRMRAVSHTRARAAGIRRATPRLAVLKAYLKDHHEGFRLAEVTRILSDAGISNQKNSRWIYFWSTPGAKTIYPPAFVNTKGVFTLYQTDAAPDPATGDDTPPAASNCSDTPTPEP